MMENKRRLAIMGGTFDPIHYGHLVAAEGARHEFNLEKVIFIPAGQPPHKKGRRITDSHYRLEMTRHAVSSNSHFEVSDIEVERTGPSYTIDTVIAVKELYPQHQVFFITGADAVLEILTWNRVEELLSRCSFIAATRPGYRLESLEHTLKNIVTMEVPALAISSTDIRHRVKDGRPIKYLLPEAVENYIKEMGLYR